MAACAAHKNQEKQKILTRSSAFLILTLPEASGIRTPDNLIKSQVLYRLS
jgi:hypothetical protein